MSEEMKNTNAQVGAQENAPSIAEKLVSAAETLNSADEEAKARRDEELKKQEAEAKEEEARRAQEEIQRREAEEKNAAYLKKKQAEMEYAENYRRKLREEKEKARALAAKRKANKLKAEAEAKAKADAEAARQEASREHAEEANRRNDEADQYVDKVEAKHEENEKALEELKTAREEAKAKRDADRAAAMQRKAENESKKDEPITLTEDAIELFPENDKSDDNKTEDQKADKPAESFVLSFDENGDLKENAPKAEEKAAPEGTLVVNFDDLNNAMNAPKAAPAAPKAESSPKAAPKAAPAAPATPSPLSAYLRDRSTLGSVTKPTDFGKDYEEKKKNAKAVLGKVKPDSGSMPNIKLPSKSTGGFEGAGALSAVSAPEKASNRKSKKTKNGVAGGEDDESNLDPSLGAVGYGDAAGNDTAAGKPEGESAAIEKEFDPAAQSGDESTTVNKGENAGDNTSLAPENNENIPSAETDGGVDGENSPKKAEAMPEGEGAAAVTALAMSKTDLKRYLDRADFFEQGLIAKEKILREKQTTYHGEISAILLRDCMDTERELLASYIDDLRRCVDSSDTKNAGYYLKKTRALVDGYNVDINNWNALTGDELKPLPESFINDSMASNEKPSLPVAELPEEVIAKYPFANDGRDESEARKAAAAKGDIGLSLGATSLSPVEEAMSRRMNTNLAEMKACAAIILLKGRNAPEGEIRRYLKGIHSYEKKLNAYEKVARYNQQRFYGESAVIHLKECLDIERALLGVYTEAYKCGKAMGDANMAKKYHEKASRAVDNYNIDLALWGNLTGTKPDMILDNFVDTVDSGAPIVIPCVTLPENITKVLSARDASYQRRIADAERQKVLAARARAAAAKASAEGANAASPDGNTIPEGAEDTAKKNKNVRSAKQAAKLAKAAKAGKAEKIAKSIEVANASEATKATKAGKKAAKATKANAFGKYDAKNLNIYEPFLVANTPKTNKLLKELMAYDASVAEMAVLPEDEMRFYNDLEMYQDVMKFNYDEDKLFTEYDNREIMADLNKALERNASFSDNDELMKDYDRFLSKHSKGKKTESFGYNEEAEMAAADTVSRKAEPNIYLADERRALRSSFNNIAYKKGEVKEGAYRKYLKNAKKYDAELIELERAEKAATVKNKKDKDALRKKINIENQLIESYSSTLVYAAEAKDAVAVSKYERKLAAQVEKYNGDLKKYSKLTGEKITPLTVEYAVKTASAGDADSAQYDKYLKRNALNEEGKRQKKAKRQNELASYENAAKDKKSRKSNDYGYEYSSRRSYADYDEYSRIAGEDEYKNSKNQLKEEKYLNDYEKYLAGKSAKKQGGSGKNYSAAYEYALANRESGKTKKGRTADIGAYSNYDEAMALRGESYGKRAKAINTGAYEEEMALRTTSVGKTKGVNGNAYDEAMALREASTGIGTKGVNGNAYDEAMALREASAGIGMKGVNGNAYDEAMALREASAGLGIKGVNGNAYDEAMALREASAGIGTKGVNGNAYDEAMALREASAGIGTKGVNGNAYDEAMALREASAGIGIKGVNGNAYDEAMALREASAGIGMKGVNGNAYDEAMALREASAGLGMKGVNGNAYDEAMALREAANGLGGKAIDGNAYDEAMALREAASGKKAFSAGNYDEAMALREAANGLGGKAIDGNAYDEAMALREAASGKKAFSAGGYDEAMALREAAAGLGGKAIDGNAYDEAMALRETASGKKAFSAGGYDEAMALREAANALGGKAIDGNAYDEAMALREAASGKKAFSAGGYDEAMALREAAAGLGMKGVDTLAYEEEMAMREIALGKKAKGSAQSYDEAMALREAASTLGIKGLDTDAYDEAMALREAASGKKAFSAGGYDEAMALREASAALSGKGVDTYAYDEAMALRYEGKNYKKSSNYLARYEAAKALDEIRSNYSKPGNAVAHYEAAMALREVQGGYSKPSNSLARYEEAMALDEIRTSYSAADNSLSRYEANLALDEIRGSYTKKDNYISAYDEMMAGREVTEYAPARSVSDEAYAAMLAGLTAGKAAKKRGAALNNEIALYEAHMAKKQVKNAGGKDYSSSAALYDSYLAEAENAAAYTKGSTSLERYEDMLRRRADGRAVAEANRESRVYRSEAELDRRNYGYNYIEERKRNAKGDESYIYDYEMSQDIKARRASSSKTTELQAYENMLEDRIAKRRRNAQYDASERKSKRENIDRLIAGYERLNNEILNRQAYEELSVIDAYEAALAEKESKKTDKRDMANDLRRFDANFVYGYSDIDIYSSDKYQNSFDSSLYGVIREPVNASNIDSFIARYEAAITAKRNSGAASASSGMYDYISNKRGGVSSFAYEEEKVVNEARDINEYVAKEAIAISEQSPNMFDRYDERAEAKYDAKHKREEKMIARYADAREEKLLRRRDGINTELEIFEERMAKRADLDPKNYDKIIAGYDNKLGNKKVKNKQAKAADAVALYEKKLSKKLGKPVAKKALSSDLITVSALEISAGEAKYFGDRALRRFIAGEAKKNGKLEATEAIAYAEVFSGSKTDNLAAISECLDAERDLIESYAKVYRAAASSENEKYSQIYLAKLTSMVDKYNSNLELAKTLSGLAVPTLPSDFKARLAKGEGVLIPTVIKNDNTATAVAHTTAPASRSEVREDMAMALARHETDKLIGTYAMEMEKELGKTLYSDEYNDITEKDIKTVSNAGALASFEAVRLLDKRELKKYLKRSAKYEKSIVSDIKDSRTRNRHSRDEYAPLYLKECLESEAKLIESLSCDYKLAYAVSDDKSIKKYEKKLKRLIAEYNIDLTEFGIVTKTAQSRIPSNSVNELRRGGVIDTPMNMPDKLLPQLGDPNSNKVYSKQLAALEGKLQDKTVEKIELNKALKSYSKMDITDKTVKDYEEYLIKSGKYTEFADVTDKIGAYSENSTHLMTKSGSKYARREEMMRVDRRAREDALTAKYEKSIEALDTTPDKKGKKNLANIYDDTMASKAYIKEQEKFFNATDLTDLNEQTAELVRTLEEGRDNDAKRALEKRDLKRYLARKRRIEKRLKQRQSAARHNYFNSTKGEAKKYLREVLGYDKALLESYVDDYETVLTVRNNHKIKEYKRLVDLGVRSYDADLGVWCGLTGEAVPKISKTLSDDIRNGEKIQPIRAIDPEDKTKPTKKQVNKNLQAFLDEEKKRERRAAIREKELTTLDGMKDGNTLCITKEHMKTDVDTVAAKIEYRKERLSNHVAEHRYRFGLDSDKQRRKMIRELAKLRKMRKLARPTLNIEKRNNKRYLEIAALDPIKMTAKIHSTVKKERAEELLNRIKSLLIERDEVNMRLLALYSDENGVKTNKRKSKRRKIAKIRLKASKKAFKKQWKLYRKAKKYRVSDKQKQRIFDAMNKKVEYRAYIAELKYRKRHEKAKGKPKHIIVKELRETKMRLRYANRDFDKAMTKASRRSRRMPSSKRQIIWGVASVIIVLCCVVGFKILLDNSDKLMGYLRLLLVKLKGVLEARQGQ